MINEICHHIQVYTTSNESFAYSQMLRENDHINYLKLWKSKYVTTKLVVIGLSC
jgi:hypothetical protein